MKRLRTLIALLGLALFATACHGNPIYFADGSWLWDVGDHNPASENYIPPGAPHGRLFGCLQFNRSQFGNGIDDDCTVDPSTDVMTGDACLFFTGSGPCKGLLGPTPPPATGVFHGVNFNNGIWTYDYDWGSFDIGCLDEFGTPVQWPCVP